MKKTGSILICAATAMFFSCNKPSNTNTVVVTETQVLTDFVNKVALPQYQSLQDKATALNTAVNNLSTTPSAANLAAARTAWQDVRAAWEQCEGFLIGPVEDDNYDPDMDTWPVDYLQLDSFITNSPSFSISVVENLTQSLRGFHPLEFILWGQNGASTVDSISSKQKQYMVALAQDILNTCTDLNSSWATTGGNFQSHFLNAGTGSTRYTTRKDAFLELVAGIADICDEVGGGKIFEPFILYDSTKAESPFSHNSITDFTNNIKGAQNVYLCSVNGTTGASLSMFVAARNISLDNKIRQQLVAAISALENVTVNFEVAIFTQRTQLQNTIDAINTLQSTLDGELKPFIQTYVKD